MGRSDDIKNGAYFAKQLMPLIIAEFQQATSKELWWSGFLGHIVGGAGASIGPEATEVLGEALKSMVSDVVKSRAN